MLTRDLSTYGCRRSGQEIDNIYGEGSGTIWLDLVSCSGLEASLSDCSHEGWGIHECDHHEDVAIECDPSLAATTLPAPGTVIATRKTRSYY